MTAKLDEMRRTAKKGIFSISEIEPQVYARCEAGASCSEVAQELGFPANYVYRLHASVCKKLEAKAKHEAYPRRIDFIN